MLIEYKGQLYKRVDNSNFKQGKHEVAELRSILGKVYFGDIVYREFFNDLRKIRD